MHKDLCKRKVVAVLGLGLFWAQASVLAADTYQPMFYQASAPTVLEQAPEGADVVQAVNAYYTDQHPPHPTVVQRFYSDQPVDMIQSGVAHRIQAINYVGRRMRP